MAAIRIAVMELLFLQLLVLMHMVSCDVRKQPYSEISSVVDHYSFPELLYPHDGLEPFIEQATVIVHHTGHHAAYTKNMNQALKEWRNSGIEKDLASMSILEILRRVYEVPKEWQKAIKNNGGGFVNHGFYFATMSPNPLDEERFPTQHLTELIDSTYGNFSEFKKWFNKQALDLFGSGYVWLCLDDTSNLLSIISTVNQDSPITYHLRPILVIDVWEHSYYLKHKNKRAQYVEDWWKVVDWNQVDILMKWWNGEGTHDEL